MAPNNLWFQKALTSCLRNSDLLIESIQAVGGGCINKAVKINSNRGTFFLKYREGHQDLFETEIKGLQLLTKTNSIRIPNIIGQGSQDGIKFLVLEYIDSSNPRADYWETLGEKLAILHQHTFKTYGLDHHNFIGSLPQNNSFSSSWVHFFRDQRLGYQIELLKTKGTISANTLNNFDKLFSKLQNLIPEEKPSLLHGDLWSGNVMIDEKGEPCLVDPAVYYGSREIELASTMLFGGFKKGFYDAYQDSFPLEGGFRERVDLYNLYPLLVHANLFGGHYLLQAEANLNKYL